MRNKLAYLGFLGLLGFTGFFGTPLLFASFAGFIFFQYINTVPDELFWNNVRICATRCFFIFLVSSNIIIVASLLLRSTENLYRYSVNVAVMGLALTWSLCIFVFCLSLWHLEAKEMRSKDEDDS
jgi:hypothetical protein